MTRAWGPFQASYHETQSRMRTTDHPWQLEPNMDALEPLRAMLGVFFCPRPLGWGLPPDICSSYILKWSKVSVRQRLDRAGASECSLVVPANGTAQSELHAIGRVVELQGALLATLALGEVYDGCRCGGGHGEGEYRSMESRRGRVAQ